MTVDQLAELVASCHELPSNVVQELEHAAWQARLSLGELGPGVECFGVQVSVTSAFVWQDVEDYVPFGLPGPVRFASMQQALEWISLKDEVVFRQTHSSWQQTYEALAKERFLYDARRRVLVDAGLWVQSDDEDPPLVAPLSAGPEPVRGAVEYSVVPDAEMATCWCE